MMRSLSTFWKVGFSSTANEVLQQQQPSLENLVHTFQGIVRIKCNTPMC